MTFKPQTAIRGVFSVGVVNGTARVLGYVKHMVIAAYIGLSAPLDAFYMAMAVLALVVFSFGDVFDSLGIPRLVESLREEGEEAFRRLAGSIFAYAVLLSAVLGGFLLLAFPAVPLIAPGFPPAKKALILRNLAWLSPLVLIYLPYHAIGSFLRARRRFLAFYVGELIIGIVALAAVYLGRDWPDIVPVSFALGYAAAFAYVLATGWGDFRFVPGSFREKTTEFTRLVFRLLPLYVVSYIYMFVDRAFASFLPTGSVSALSYGMLIAMAPSSILVMENVFITPLAESKEKAEMMGRILTGIVITSVPVAAFAVVNSGFIVQAALERGVFTPVSTEMTAEALAYLGVAIPGFFIWPVAYRLFQVMDRLWAASATALAGVLLTALLNAVFMRRGMGIKGVALATSAGNYLAVAGGLWLLGRLGIRVGAGRIIRVVLLSAGVSGIALAVVAWIPLAPTLGGLAVRGAAFLLSAGALYAVAPGEDVRYWRETMRRELLPSRR